MYFCLCFSLDQDCPRPAPVKNGKIVISGTSSGSKAELTCDDGYMRSTGYATCNSGKWDVAMKCNRKTGK